MAECTCSKRNDNGVVTYLKENDCAVCGPVTAGERRPAPPVIQEEQGEPKMQKKTTTKEAS